MCDRPARGTRRGRHSRRRLVTDGGTPDEESDGESGDGVDEPEGGADEPEGDADEPAAGNDAPASGGTEAGDGTPSEPSDEGDDEDAAASDRSNVEVMEAGEAEPVDPKWEPPDVDDIPEFEVSADHPPVESGAGADEAGDARKPDDRAGGGTSEDTGTGPSDDGGGGPAGDASAGAPGEDPTAGMPHDARAPGATAVTDQGTEAYVAAIELCARLPDDVRLPGAAADLVPAAVEAELEQDVQSFAAAEFDNPRPHVETLEFEEREGDVWLRIRIGLPAADFRDLDTERLRSFALQELEGVL